MVGQTAYANKAHKLRMGTIKTHCGCLCCLLMGYADVHTSIEHVTENGRRIGDQHSSTIGLCGWHHFGTPWHGKTRAQMIEMVGPALAHGRRSFEDYFGDEVHILLPVQNLVLELFERSPWPEYNLPADVAQTVRLKWIELNRAPVPLSSSARSP